MTFLQKKLPRTLKAGCIFPSQISPRLIYSNWYGTFLKVLSYEFLIRGGQENTKSNPLNAQIDSNDLVFLTFMMIVVVIDMVVVIDI